MPWLINWISSPGLWRGVVYLLTSAGITLAPDQENSIIAAGLAVAGIIHAFSAAHPKP